MNTISNSTLLRELRRLEHESKNPEFCLTPKLGLLNAQDKEALQLFKQIIDNCSANKNYTIMKYKLASNALGIAHWDIDILGDDAADLNNRFTWSPELRSMLGYQDEYDFVDSFGSWLKRIHKDDAQAAIDEYMRHINDSTEQAPINIEYRVQKANGEYLLVRAFGAAQRDETGKILRIAGAAEDITLKKITEKRIREADERGQIMLDAVPLALTLWNKDLDIIDCTKRAVVALGFSDKQELMSNFLHCMPKHQPNGRLSAEMLVEELTTIFKTGYNNLEWTHYKANGEAIYLDIEAARVEYKNDHALMLIARDTEKEKRLQADINARDEQMAAQAHWYRSILDGIPLPISVTDAAMKLTFTNRAAENIFNSDRADLIGKPCNVWQVPICDTDDCCIVRAKAGYNQTFFKHNDRSFQVNTEILKDLSGDTIGYLEVLNDITAAENSARQEADAASEAKSTFLATMSHEMRTPLNAIIGMAAIGNRSADMERKNYALDKIEESSNHLLGIVNDVLDMSKIEANKLELFPVEFSIENMLKKVIAVIDYRAKEKRQSFTLDIKSDVPRFIIGDDQRLAQVITNLLSNAVKFTAEDGEVGLEISQVSCLDGYSVLRFEVADSGIGISDEQKSRLFNTFSQAETGTSRVYGGTGLGLSISKALVEMMGGDIWIESELGCGSRFIFTIRVPGCDKSLRTLLCDSVRWDGVRVLVVDDSYAVRHFYEESFSRLGISCDIAADIDSAKRMVSKRTFFDMCFIDCPPQETKTVETVEFAKWLRTKSPNCAVVLTAASNWEALQAAVQECHANKSLIKPIFSSALVDCLNECLDNNYKELNFENTNEFAGKTLLLAEDIEINREIVMALLEGTALTIECAENGRDALALMHANPDKYDIIFMDMQMPFMDGLEATRQIRALNDAWCKQIPIIAMTANVFKDDIAECLLAGMNDHVGKPISMDSTLAVLHKYLAIEPQVGEVLVSDAEYAETCDEKHDCDSTKEPTAQLKCGMQISIDIRTCNEHGKKMVISLPSVVEELIGQDGYLIHMPVLEKSYYNLLLDDTLLLYFTLRNNPSAKSDTYALPVRYKQCIERDGILFAKVVPLAKAAKSERRYFNRSIISIPIKFLRAMQNTCEEQDCTACKSGSLSLEGKVVNFSDGGVLLCADEKLEVGERITLLYNTNDKEVDCCKFDVCETLSCRGEHCKTEQCPRSLASKTPDGEPTVTKINHGKNRIDGVVLRTLKEESGDHKYSVAAKFCSHDQQQNERFAQFVESKAAGLI